MLKDRIKKAMELAGINQAELAAACGVSRPSVNDWVRGETRSLKGASLTRASKALGVNADWLAHGAGPMRRESAEAEAEDWSDVKGYVQAVGLGDGVEGNESYAETHKLKFRAKSLQRKGLQPHRLGVVYGRGESMLPRIRHGDAILFDTGDTSPRDDALFVIFTQGAKGPEYSAKRCVEIGGEWFFDALNPTGDHAWRKPRKMVDERKPITIIGRIRWIGSWED